MPKIEIINGESSPACKTASSLRAGGHFVETITEIIDETISQKLLTTGTVRELFLTLAVSGDIQDAFGLVDLQYERYMSGLIVDSDTLLISNLRLILYACLESYEGLEIIPYLKVLSGMENYPVTLEDLDTKINTGTYSYIIQETVKAGPEDVEHIIRDAKRLIDISNNKANIRTELDDIKKDFAEAFERTKGSIISALQVSSPSFYDAVELKRAGKYKEANKIYCNIVTKEKSISTPCALAWYKVLACSGDIQDAVTLAQTVLRAGDPNDQSIALLMTNFYRLIFCMEGVKGNNPIEYLRKISGNPNYGLEITDLDVHYCSGIFKPIIEQCPKDYYRLIVQLLP